MLELIFYSFLNPGDPLPAADARCWPATSQSSRPLWLWFRNKREHALTAPLFLPGSHPWGSSRQPLQVSPVTSCDTRAGATARLQRPSGPTGQTDLSWARDEWAHFCTGGDPPSCGRGTPSFLHLLSPLAHVFLPPREICVGQHFGPRGQAAGSFPDR